MSLRHLNRSLCVACHAQEEAVLPQEVEAVTMDGTHNPATDVPGFVHVFGVHIPCRAHAGGHRVVPAGAKLVVTPSVAANMETFAHALCGGRPVLLEGPPGCGKSSLLRHFAALTGAGDGSPSQHMQPSSPFHSARFGLGCAREALCDDDI